MNELNYSNNNIMVHTRQVHGLSCSKTKRLMVDESLRYVC